MLFPCNGIFLLSRAWPYMGIALTTTTVTTELGVQWVTQEGGERRGEGSVSATSPVCGRCGDFDGGGGFLIRENPLSFSSWLSRLKGGRGEGDRPDPAAASAPILRLA